MKTFLLLMLVACGGKAAAPTTSSNAAPAAAVAGPDCEAAISNSLALSKETLSKNGVDEAGFQKMHDTGVEHCKADKWSGEAVQCMVDAKAMDEAQGCCGKLTPEQQQAMNAAART